ncbi:MAG: hypothetical protein RL297_1930 [Pseudomonadota bacterium]|jgi:uncharacterized protein (DUF1800 family)
MHHAITPAPEAPHTQNDKAVASPVRDDALTPRPLLVTAAPLVGGLGLVACGGGSSSANLNVSVEPETFNAQTASRFLSQAAFGGNATEIERVLAMGYSAWLDEQMAMPLTQSHKDWLIEKGHHLRGDNNANLNGNGGWDRSAWRKFLSSPDALRQRMVLAWSELFVVSALGLPIGWKNFAIANYLDMLEARAFGNFREILEAVTLSSAMGTYLNMKNNKKADSNGRVPDENYAREVMQLFTIGLYQLNEDGTPKLDAEGNPIETYDNNDTQGLAAVFTGWRSATGTDPQTDATKKLENAAYQHGLPMALTAGDHSSTEKKFLGTTIPAGTNGTQSLKRALDTLVNHPNTAPFVAKHFIARFVTSNPSPAYVQRVVNVFKNNGQNVRGDMAAVIKAVLLDKEARQAPNSTQQGKLREPMIRLMQWARTFGARSDNGLWSLGLTNADTGLGQMPMYSPSVFNFFRPGYVPPNTALASAGLVAPEFQITSEPTVVGYISYMASTVNNGRAAVTVDYTNEMPLADNSQALVDRYNLWFAAGQLGDDTVQTIKTAIDTINASTDTGKLNRIYTAILLVMSSPEYLVQK